MSCGATARRRHAVQKRWLQVWAREDGFREVLQVHARCAEGHEITGGQWALFWPFRPGLPRYILCEAHAKAAGYARPTQAGPAGPDVKLRQAGEE